MSTLSFNNYPKSASADIAKGIARDDFAKHIAAAILGAVGVAIVYPFLLPFRLKLLLDARRLYKNVHKDTVKVYNSVQKMSPEDVMNTHLHYERMKNELIPQLNDVQELVTAKFGKRNLAIMANGYFEECSKLVTELEKDLKSVAYPEIDQPLTQSQMEELEIAFKGISADDWEDISDDYKKAYFQ